MSSCAVTNSMKKLMAKYQEDSAIKSNFHNFQELSIMILNLMLKILSKIGKISHKV